MMFNHSKKVKVEINDVSLSPYSVWIADMCLEIELFWAQKD